jgi:hypothetical protein
VWVASGAANVQGWRRDVLATTAPFIWSFCRRGASVKSERTVLSSFQEGDVWRVRIEWPNGAVHYFGNFASEKDAMQWIDAHAWLTTPVTKNNKGEPSEAAPPSADGGEQQTNSRA